MKILIIRMFPNVVNINNYNMQEIGLANALIKKGHICDIVYYGNENKIQILENNIKIYWVKGKNFLKNAIYDKSLYEIVKDYDVIQTSEYNQIGNIKLLKECGNKLVIYHGPYASIYNKKFQFKCNLFDKVYFNFYPKYKEVPIIAKSKLAENYLRSKKFKNITTIGVGFNPQRFENIKSNNDKFKEISSDFVNLLYVGEINDNKNIKFLLKTFHKVCCNCKNVKLIIVGKGTDEYKNECFDLAKQLGIFENIIYYQNELKVLKKSQDKLLNDDLTGVYSPDVIKDKTLKIKKERPLVVCGVTAKDNTNPSTKAQLTAGGLSINYVSQF